MGYGFFDFLYKISVFPLNKIHAGIYIISTPLELHKNITKNIPKIRKGDNIYYILELDFF